MTDVANRGRDSEEAACGSVLTRTSEGAVRPGVDGPSLSVRGYLAAFLAEAQHNTKGVCK